ncbi:MAG: leucyl aminopeptidase [Anaerolineae bacterium]
MEISTVTGAIGEQKTDAVAIGLFEEEVAARSAQAAGLDAALSERLSTVLADGDFRGKRNETLVLYTYGALPAKRLILVGLGKRDAFQLDTIRQAAATVAKKGRALGLTEIHLSLFGAGVGDASRRTCAAAIVEGALLGLYRFTELKTQHKDERPDPERLIIIATEEEHTPDVEEGLRLGRVVAESTMLTRDLVNRPANLASPAHLVEVGREIASSTGLISRVLDKPALEALGMELLLSVNQGGRQPAQMIVLEHNADRSDLPTVVLVGKGITFDTGGISLKSSQGMERMKGDMAGAAAILGTLRAVALLDLPLHVVGLAPLTENMPDANATRPGDVKGSLKGLTVEIINTDAEGRLILADALTYAGEFEPDAILDIATLTGGRIVALGRHAAAVMGNDGLIERLRQAGEATGERVWPLPLFEEYGKQLESDVADLKNVGGREASSITAGYFLSKFTPENTPWVHIDIAGLEIAEKADAYISKGGTGFGVRLLVEALRSW